MKYPLSVGIFFLKKVHNSSMERDESKKSSASNPFSVPEKFKNATSPFLIDGFDSKI